MATTRYRVTFNGFKVNAETWDDFTNSDGQHDEVFFQSVSKKSRSDGTVIVNGDMSTFTSVVMGDVSSPATLGPAGQGRQRATALVAGWWARRGLDQWGHLPVGVAVDAAAAS